MHLECHFLFLIKNNKGLDKIILKKIFLELSGENGAYPPT